MTLFLNAHNYVKCKFDGNKFKNEVSINSLVRNYHFCKKYSRELKNSIKVNE